MPSYPLFLLLFLMACALWLVALVVLFAHRMRPLIGLTPMLVILGGLAGAIQFPHDVAVTTTVAGYELLLQFSDFLFLPVLLMGLLVLYIIEGTVRARSAAFGIIGITVLAAIFRVISSEEFLVIQGNLLTKLLGGGFRELTSVTLALIADLFTLVIVYQWVSNVYKHYPNLPAVILAFLATLWSDALVYTSTSFQQGDNLWVMLSLHLVGKTFAGIVLTPAVLLYLRIYSRTFPNSTITTSRPVLDIFTTSLELEARARYNYNLLQTILKVNHMVVRATNLQDLLNQACKMLVSNQEYLIACIYLDGSKPVTAWAGHNPSLIAACMLDNQGRVQEDTPAQSVLQNRKLLVVNHIKRLDQHSHWVQEAQKHGIGSLACFPILAENQSLGIMIVGAVQELAFLDEEVEALQELVNDLANAITNFQVRQAQATLITAAEMFPDGLLITDLAGEIVYTNPAVAQIWGVNPKSLPGKNITNFFPRETRRQMIETSMKELTERGILELEFDLAPPGGDILCLSVRAAPVYDAEHTPRQIVISLRDVTSRKQYERQLLALNRLITDLVQRHVKEELLPFVFTAAEELFNARACALYMMDTFGKITDLMSHNLPESYAQRMLRGYRGLPCETVVRTHRPVTVANVLSDPAYQGSLDFIIDYGIHALLALPVLSEIGIIGVLVIYFEHTHEFTDEEIQLGMTLSHTVAIALQNIYLYQAERSQRRFAEGLAQAAASLNRLLNPDEVLDQILDQAMRITTCRSSRIILVDGMNVRSVRRKGYTGALLPQDVEQTIFPLQASTIHFMYETGDPLLISDSLQDKRWVSSDPPDLVRSYACVPLKVSGQVVGFLNVDSDLPGAFSHETLQRLQALADHASIAIHNAELYSESNRQAQELATLVQSAAMVSTSLDVTVVLEELCKQMAHLVGVEGCAISSYDQAAMTVTLMGYYRGDTTNFEPAWQMPYNLRDFPLTQHVLQDNSVVQIHASDAQSNPSELVRMNLVGVKTLLMMPLVAQDVTLGLVELESVDAGRVFSQREISLLQTLGANAANAIQHARLFKQLQEYTGMLEQRVEERTGELRSAKEHIESILASIPDAIFVLDDQYQPIRSNQAGDALILSAQADQLDLFEPEFLTKLRSGLLPAESSLLATRGRFYQALSSPFPVQPGQEGLVVVFRDVTRFRELDEIKTHFVSDVSHELRTPLTNLLLYLDLLTTAQDPEKGQGYITTLMRETQRLSFLIEDLLTISRLEAGRVTITIKPTDVNRLISELAADRMMLAASSQLKLAFVPQQELPLALTDASLLVQGVSNLLTNAINYTPAGGSVTLSTHLRGDNGASWVTIDIADTGVGIPLEEQLRIFERFYRGSASRKTGAAGTGLGLAIAQDIARRLDGKLSMESQPGEGSTFTFWLKAVL